ncbi:hypothetical protein GSI_09341 [Ganoderma sinense ZZ0214-1]|uniref:Uncharacterized protein n=1 Tax=Ganoderma sinense ZZ0214-1 TaxID=1077348 RepID=A0A2G8S685_9APHY|nr:hypothetical protein GSI_09341 [Ganoderma sinense ZZ0214-1]
MPRSFADLLRTLGLGLPGDASHFVNCPSQREIVHLQSLPIYPESRLANFYYSLMLFRNHEVWIAYDGVPVPELAPSISGPNDASSNVATAYLMSENDKVFTVNWRHLVPESIVSMSVRMDDVLVNQLISMPGAGGGQLGGIVSGPASIRPFAFSNVPRLPCELIRSGSLLEDRQLVGKGAYSLVIPIMPAFDIGSIDEEAIIFEFRYAPLVCLQHIGIVAPRTLIAESDPENLSTLTSGPSTLGKRTRSQYEDMSSPSQEPEMDVGAAGAAAQEGTRVLITRRRATKEVEDSAIAPN